METVSAIAKVRFASARPQRIGIHESGELAIDAYRLALDVFEAAHAEHYVAKVSQNLARAIELLIIWDGYALLK